MMTMSGIQYDDRRLPTGRNCVFGIKELLFGQDGVVHTLNSDVKVHV